ADEGAQREAAAERLGEHQQIGHRALVLIGEQPAGATEGRHHLVEDQEGADLVAAPSQRGQKPWARHAYATLGLHRLYDHRRGAVVDPVELRLVAGGWGNRL